MTQPVEERQSPTVQKATLCAACGWANLPGGVRCDRCGEHFPVQTDPSRGVASTAPAAADAEPSPPAKKKSPSGLFAGVAFLILKGKSLLVLLKLGPLLTTLGSMGFFIAFYSRLFGWKLAVGFTVCLFIHELGHVVANRRRGVSGTAPLFVPLMGAVIFLKKLPADPMVEAEVGAGGPIAGLGASLICALMAVTTREPFWMALAHISFWLNLFNLIPVWQFDGAHITTVFSPAIWNMVLVALVVGAVSEHSSYLWIILIAGLVTRPFRASSGRHLLVPSASQRLMAIMFVGLCLSLAFGATQTEQPVQHSPGQQSGVTASAGRGLAASRDARYSIVGRNHPRTARWLPHRHGFSFRPYLIFGLGWSLVAWLLRSAARPPVGPGPYLFVAVMLAVHSLVVESARFLFFTRDSMARLLAVYVVSLFTALLFSLARRTGDGKGSLPWITLVWRCANVMFTLCLVASYLERSGFGFVFVFLLAALFYLALPWLLLSRLARYWTEAGEIRKSRRARDLALKVCRNAECRAMLLSEAAAAESLLSAGTSALELVQRARAEYIASAVKPRLQLSLLEALALAHLDHREEIFAWLGTIVKRRVENEPQTVLAAGASAAEAAAADQPSIPSGEDRGAQPATLINAVTAETRGGPARPQEPVSLAAAAKNQKQLVGLLSIYLLLARMAYLRGWLDQAGSRLEMLLNLVPKNATGDLLKMKSQALLLRAEVLSESGQPDRALTELEAASGVERNAEADLHSALVRCSAALQKQDFETAERESKIALHRIPGNLQARFWRARTLLASGNVGASRAELGSLASEHPQEHWGRAAREMLTQLSPAGV